ncbi:MAG: TRAP transporter substrate-binding protein DctP, partial [Gammaproteobacteria bacterium]
TPVRRPEDFAGIRFRVMTAPLLIATYEQYGASPTPLPYAEVYSALQLRMIDGQENPVFAIEEMSFYEITDYLIFPRHAEFITTVAANARFFEGLEVGRRRLVEQVIDQLQSEIDEVQRRYNRQRLERIRELSREIRSRYVESAGARGKRLLALIETAIERAEVR